MIVSSIAKGHANYMNYYWRYVFVYNMVPNFLHEYSVQILLYNIQSPFDLKSYKRLPEIKKKIIIIIKR